MKKHQKKYYLSLFLLIFFPLILHAQEKEHKIVELTVDDWVVYDPEFYHFIPFNSELHKNLSTAGIFLNTEKLLRNDFFVFLPEESYIFINNKLVKKTIEDGWNKISLNHINKKDSLSFLTIYCQNNKIIISNSFYGKIFKSKEVINTSPINANILDVKEKDDYLTVFHNFFVINLLVVLILVAVSKNLNYKIFSVFYGFQSLTQIASGQSFMLKKPLNLSNLFAILVHCIILAFTFFLIQNISEDIFGISLFSKDEPLQVLLYKLYILAFVSVVLYILKFFLIVIMTEIFNLKEFRFIHFYYSIKLSMIFYLFLLPTCILLYLWASNLPELFQNSLIGLSLILFAIIKILIISFHLNKIRTFQNLYLFSYLCTIEIIPLFIAYQMVLN